MLRLNNRGYMLVEIILASVLAFGIGFFLISLTIRIKNTNDDFLVKTQVSTDNAIITNMLMKEIYRGNFKCDNLVIDTSNNSIAYGTEKIFVNEYSKLPSEGEYTCNDSDGKIYIPLIVKQLPNEDFNVDIVYKK